VLTWTFLDGRALRTCERKYYFRSQANRMPPDLRTLRGFVTVREWAEQLTRTIILDEIVLGSSTALDVVLQAARARFERELGKALRNEARADPTSVGLIQVDRGGTLSRREKEMVWSFLVRRVTRHHQNAEALGSLQEATVRSEAGMMLRHDVRVSAAPDIVMPVSPEGLMVVEVSGATRQVARARLLVAALVTGAERLVHWRWGRVQDVRVSRRNEFRARVLKSADRMMLVEAAPSPLSVPITQDARHCAQCPFYGVCGRQAPRGSKPA
jgi:hypothetical protein